MAPAVASEPVMSLPTVNVQGVEQMRTGTWYPHVYDAAGNLLAGAAWEVTPEYLDQIVASFNETHEALRPGIKLGHDGPLPRDASGAPLLGEIVKLWREGDRLLANYAGVPKRIAEALASGWDNRSVEVADNAVIGGKQHAAVLEAIALLGFDLPAVSGMDGVFALYASASPRSSRRVLSARAGAPAMSESKIPDAEPTWLDKFVERVVTAFRAPKDESAEAAAEQVEPAADESAKIAAAAAVQGEIASLKAARAAQDAELAAVRAQLAAASEAQAVSDAEALVAHYEAARKITPAMLKADGVRASLVKVARENPAAFKAQWEAAPEVIPAPGRKAVDAGDPDAGEMFTAAQIEAARLANGLRTSEEAVGLLTKRAAAKKS